MVRKNRLVWIGNIRGLLMFFVIIFHACQQYGTDWFLVFLRLLILPLFFFMSGMLLKNNMSFSDFVKQKFNHVVVPYFQFSALTYVIYLVHKVSNHEYMKEYNPLNLLMGIFYASHCHTFPLLNFPLWFLPCLFIVQCLLFYFLRFPKPVFSLILVVLACIGTLLDLSPFPLPWSFAHACSFAIFAGLGYMLAPKLCRASAVMPPTIVALCFAVWIAGSGLIQNVSLNAGLSYVSNTSVVLGVVSYVTSIAAILGMIGLFQRIPKVPYLSTVGKYSIEVLALHPIAFMLVTTLLRRLVHIPVERSSQNLIDILSPLGIYAVIFAYLIAGIAIPMIYVHCFNFVATRKTFIKNKLKETYIVMATYSIKRIASL